MARHKKNSLCHGDDRALDICEYLVHFDHAQNESRVTSGVGVRDDAKLTHHNAISKPADNTGDGAGGKSVCANADCELPDTKSNPADGVCNVANGGSKFTNNASNVADDKSKLTNAACNIADDKRNIANAVGKPANAVGTIADDKRNVTNAVCKLTNAVCKVENPT